MRFVLMHPGVSTVLVGFSDLAQIEAAMQRLHELWGTDFGRGG